MSAKPTAGHDPGYAKYEYTTVHKQDVTFTFKPNAPRQFVKDLEAAVEEEIGKEPGKYHVAIDDEIRRSTDDSSVVVLLCIDARIVMIVMLGWEIAREWSCLTKYTYETTLGQRVSYRFRVGVPKQFLHTLDAMVSQAINKKPGRYTFDVDCAVRRASDKSITVILWRENKIQYTAEVPGWKSVDDKPRSATA